MGIFKIHLVDKNGVKNIIFITKDSKIKHIYTLNNTSDTLGEIHPIRHLEQEKRVLSRLKSAHNVAWVRPLTFEQVLKESLKASRPDVAAAIYKRLYYYYSLGIINFED